MIRLQKALADRGVASRRKAEELITAGRVRVGGETVTTLGTKVPPGARIEVDGAATRQVKQRYVLLNKPAGIVSTAHDERGRRTVVELVAAPERLYPVGRLDTDSEGMLLLTNDGDWAERVLHPRYGHEREYDVAVSGDLSTEAIAQLRNGVRLEEGLAVAVRIDVLSRSRGTSRLRMVLHTGWRRQIRRMLAAVGLKTVRLVRVRIGALALGKLREGAWRDLTPAEVAMLARSAEHARAAAGQDAVPVAAPKPGRRRGSGQPPSPRSTSARASGARSVSARPPVAARPGSRGPRPSFARGARPSPGRGSRSQPARPARPVTGRARAPQRPAFALRPSGRRPPRYGTTGGPVRAKVAPR